MQGKAQLGDLFAAMDREKSMTMGPQSHAQQSRSCGRHGPHDGAWPAGA
jgi:hypothetical protein